MDLLKLIPEDNITANHFETILALFKKSKGQQKAFYEGRRPSYEDVQLILSRIKSVIKNESAENLSSETLD